MERIDAQLGLLHVSQTAGDVESDVHVLETLKQAHLKHLRMYLLRAAAAPGKTLGAVAVASTASTVATANGIGAALSPDGKVVAADDTA